MLVLAISLVSGLSAQTHNAVPVTETQLYSLLEIARIRGLIDPLPSAKPYHRSLVTRALYEIDENRAKLSRAEKEVLDDFIERYAEDVDRPFTEDGDLRVEHDVFPLKFGGYVDGEVSVNLNEFKDSLSGSGVLGIYAQGDLGKYFSWGIDLNGGLFLVDDYDEAYSYGPTSYEPYTYSKEWDGGMRPLSNMSGFVGMPTGGGFGYAFKPEIAASFWDNRVDLRFARVRHDWGIGEGSLQLDGGSRPFFAFEVTFDPAKWFTITSLTGVLDYYENYRNDDDYHIGFTAREQQNMYSVWQIESTPVDWLYISIFDAVVYTKRTELGYVMPLMSRLLSQNNSGDFDNLMLGGTLGLSWPGLFQTYFSIYLDEARDFSSNFFNNPANMYSIQTGIKAPIPGIPWSNMVFQYTKIEPYTYSHYSQLNPPGYTAPLYEENNPSLGYLYAMDTSYMNGGESLGYGLEPNSDEFLLRLGSNFRKGISWSAQYRMIRHGYPGSVGGSTFDTWGFEPGDPTITPDSDPDGAYYDGKKKFFLKDGVYEWYHIATISGVLDTGIWNEPVQFGLSYSFVALYYSDFSSNGNYKPLNNAQYPNTFRNIVTFSVSVSPY